MNDRLFEYAMAAFLLFLVVLLLSASAVMGSGAFFVARWVFR